MNLLLSWGWNEQWAAKAVELGATLEPPPNPVAGSPDPEVPALRPGRVIRQVHHHYHLVTAWQDAPLPAEVSGAFSYRAASPADYPTAGDWVLIGAGGRIEKVLPRRSAISRHASGEETLEQVIAANIDVIFLVFGLDGGRNFTVGLLERSLVAAWSSGARPVVVLNKADCAEEDAREQAHLDAETHGPGVPVHVVSAVTGEGLEGLLAEAAPGETIGLLGKSGVGKSALINAFAGDSGSARTGEQRKGDLQGRHTTSDKTLYRLPEGVIMADVPGLRELQLWGDTSELASAFPEIEALAAKCRFSDCAHSGEPGCGIQEALASGELPVDRYERYLEYQRELAYLERRRDQRAGQEEERRWKQIAKVRRQMKGKRG